jgi:hypothetical protein
LWAAVSLHALMNVLLHAVSELGPGPAAFEPVFERSAPSSFDLPFCIYLLTARGVALAMSRLSAVRRGAAWLEGR